MKETLESLMTKEEILWSLFVIFLLLLWCGVEEPKRCVIYNFLERTFLFTQTKK